MAKFNPSPIEWAYQKMPKLNVAQALRRQAEIDAAREEAEQEREMRAKVEQEQLQQAVVEATPRKRCSRCRELLPLDAFTKSADTKDGLYAYCRECRRERRKIYRNPEIEFTSYIRRRYGISSEEYRARYDAQAGCCAICGVHAEAVSFRRNGMLCLDHDHKTGELRAMLCGGCNTAIGHFRDSPAILRSAIAYLERYGIR